MRSRADVGNSVIVMPLEYSVLYAVAQVRYTQTMLSEENAKILTEYAKKVNDLTDKLSKATAERNNVIRDALGYAKPTEISRLTGISRIRIYQIRDRRS